MRDLPWIGLLILNQKEKQINIRAVICLKI
jgi:hypothetical protein